MQGDSEIALGCVRYLSLAVEATLANEPQDTTKFVEGLSDLHLLAYALAYLPEHLERLANHPDIQDLIDKEMNDLVGRLGEMKNSLICRLLERWMEVKLDRPIKADMDQGAASFARTEILLEAAAERHISVVRAALLAYTNIDRLGSLIRREDALISQTPLVVAAEKGHLAVVKLLLDHGANIERRDSKGWSPLSYAAETGHEAVVELLLYHGANTEAGDKDGGTPLSYAAGNGHDAVVKLLLDHGASIERRDSKGWSPLSYAAGNGHDAVVLLLLKRGANVEANDKDGRTPLSYAAETGHVAVARLLLERGAAIEAEDKDGGTPLSYAAGNGHEAVVRLLRSYVSGTLPAGFTMPQDDSTDLATK